MAQSAVKTVKSMDIFKRTCCKPILLEPSSKTEIDYEVDFAEEEFVEEEAIFEEDKLDINKLYRELECMKRRIQVLQLHLKKKVDECPEEACIDYEILLNCSQNKEICDLQKNQYKLQCQINDLLKCCCMAKDHIYELRVQICERTKELRELQKSVRLMYEWKAAVLEDFGKCIERFEYLKHVKAEWEDVETKMNELRKVFSTFEFNFMPKNCYLQEKQELLVTLQEMKRMMVELFEYQLTRFASIEERLANIA